MSFYSTDREVKKAIRQEYCNPKQQRICERLLLLYDILLERTNTRETQITFGGKRITLKPGSVYFSVAKLVPKLKVSRKIIDEDIKRLAKFLPHTSIKSSHPYSGGHIITWLKPNEVQHPWTKIKKISKKRGSQANSHPATFSNPHCPRGSGYQTDSESHRRSHTIKKEEKLININNSLNNSKINTPSTISGLRRELVDKYKKYFQIAKVQPATVNKFYEDADAAGISDKEMLDGLEEISKDCLMKELFWGLGGLVYLRFRREDRDKIVAASKSSFASPKSCYDTVEEHIEHAFQTTLTYYRQRNKNSIQSFSRPIKLTKTQFCKRFGTEIESLKAMYQKRNEELKEKALVQAAEKAESQSTEQLRADQHYQRYLEALCPENGGSEEKAKPYFEVYLESIRKIEVHRKAEKIQNSEPIEQPKTLSETRSDLVAGSELGSENSSRPEHRSEKSNGSESGSDIIIGAETEKSAKKQKFSEHNSESETTKPDISEGSELAPQTETDTSPTFNDNNFDQTNDPDFDHDVGLSKTKIQSLIETACDEKSLTTSLYKAGMKSSAQEYRFKDKYYQAVHERAEFLWNKKMHDYIQLGFTSSEPEFKRKFSKKYPFPYFRRKRQEQLVNFEKLIGRVA